VLVWILLGREVYLTRILIFSCEIYVTWNSISLSKGTCHRQFMVMLILLPVEFICLTLQTLVSVQSNAERNSQQ